MSTCAHIHRHVFYRVPRFTCTLSARQEGHDDLLLCQQAFELLSHHIKRPAKWLSLPSSSSSLNISSTSDSCSLLCWGPLPVPSLSLSLICPSYLTACTKPLLPPLTVKNSLELWKGKTTSLQREHSLPQKVQKQRNPQWLQKVLDTTNEWISRKHWTWTGTFVPSVLVDTLGVCHI